MFVYNCLRGNLDSLKSTNIKWSQKFSLDQLPPELNDSLDLSDAQSIKLLEEKIDKLDLISIQAGYVFEINQQSTEEDLGVCIERTSEQTVHKDKDFVKWRRGLLKKCQQVVMKVFKSTYDERLNKKLRSRIDRFLHEKASLTDDEKYSQFLRETIKKAKLLKRDVIFQNSSFSGDTQTVILTRIKTAINLFLNKE